MSGTPISFVWYELVTTDAAAAKAFYAKVMGWTLQEAGNPNMDYTLFLTDAGPVAGVMTLSKEAQAAGARQSWIGYVGVPDVDDYVSRLVAKGGHVYAPAQDIPHVGRFSVVADPQGAAFVLFTGQAGMTPPPTAPLAPGYVGWHELMASDGATAFDFYADMFGWEKKEAIDMGPMGTYQVFGNSQTALGGMMTKPPHLPIPFWGYYIRVEAISAAIERLTAVGGTVVNGPHPVPGGDWIVQTLDPQGALFSLVSRGE